MGWSQEARTPSVVFGCLKLSWSIATVGWSQEAGTSFCCRGYLKLSWSIATVGWSQESRTSICCQPLNYLKLRWSIATVGCSHEARTSSSLPISGSLNCETRRLESPRLRRANRARGCRLLHFRLQKKRRLFEQLI